MAEQSVDVRSPVYEMASVLFMDIVRYSLETIDRQAELLTQLQQLVRATAQFQTALAKDELLTLPAGDGLALVFMRDPFSPVLCALQIADSLKSCPGIQVRMGVHTGPVYRHADIKENINVVGAGINIAQRVMDFGDAGHILLSATVAEVLDQFADWRGCLHDLGTQEVKHGVKIHLYNLCRAGLGNSEAPRKLNAKRAVEEPSPGRSSGPAQERALETPVAEQLPPQPAGNKRAGRHIGRYEITGELGRGGMGIVYDAVDPLIDRNVAVKVINLQTPNDPKQAEFLRQQLFREARAVGKLSHPGIVVIFDVGEEGDQAFIAMERVEGQTLQQRLASGPKLSREDALIILRQTAQALDYAHENGSVHRDIKPGNLMICAGTKVKVADFGIAKINSPQQTHATTMLMGTPNYMSPEQFDKQPLDGRSDQFSLGVVAFRLLTGRVPFEADSFVSLMQQIVAAPRPSASTVNPELPRNVDEVLQRALSKLRDERFASCSDFVAALDQAFQDLRPASRNTLVTTPLPATAIPEQPAAVPGRSEFTVRRVSIAAGVLTLVVAAGFAYRLSMSHRSSGPPAIAVTATGPSGTTSATISVTPSKTRSNTPSGPASGPPSGKVEAVTKGRPTSQPQPAAAIPDVQAGAKSNSGQSGGVPDSGKGVVANVPGGVTGGALPPPVDRSSGAPAKLKEQLAEGKRLYDSGQCQDAASWFEKIVRAEPENAFAQNALGLAYVCLKMNKPAAERFQMAIQMKPDYAAAYLNRGQLYLGSAQYELAIQDLTWGIEREPENATFYWRRGRAFFATRSYEDAQNDFERAIKLDPSEPHGYHGRGKVLHQLGQYREALSAYDQAIARKQDYATAYTDRAATRDRLGDRVGAAADREAAKRYAGRD